MGREEQWCETERGMKRSNRCREGGREEGRGREREREREREKIGREG